MIRDYPCYMVDWEKGEPTTGVLKDKYPRSKNTPQRSIRVFFDGPGVVCTREPSDLEKETRR